MPDGKGQMSGVHRAANSCAGQSLSTNGPTIDSNEERADSSCVGIIIRVAMARLDPLTRYTTN